MWKPVLMIALVLATGGCARPRVYSAPAPAGALDCALREALDLGYQRMTGEPQEGYIRVAQRIEPSQLARRREADPLPGSDRVLPDASDAPVENQLAFQERRGQLRIQVVSVTRAGEAVAPQHDAEAHAQIILATCSAP